MIPSLQSAFAVLLLFASSGSVINAFAIDSENGSRQAVSVTSGVLYAYDSVTGETHHRINRRHLNAVNSSYTHSMRLDMGQDGGILDIHLTEDSAWSDQSTITIRHGDETRQVPNIVDPRCFLSGVLASQNGVMTLSRCGKIYGSILTDSLFYEIEEMATSNDGNGEFDDLVNVKITISKPDEEDAIFDENEDILINTVKNKFEVDSEKSSITKRQSGTPTVEVGIFFDSFFIRTMRGVNLTEYTIMKWNKIRQVLLNPANAGMEIDIQVKNLEFWYEDPPLYAREREGSELWSFMDAYCMAKPGGTPDYDFSMIYSSKRDARGFRGLAYVNDICSTGNDCAIVKNMGPSPLAELHEMLHTLGLPHTERIADCPVTSRGIMHPSGDPTLLFLDCYRRRLRQTVPQKRCLYRQDVFGFSVLNN